MNRSHHGSQSASLAGTSPDAPQPGPGSLNGANGCVSNEFPNHAAPRASPDNRAPRSGRPRHSISRLGKLGWFFAALLIVLMVARLALPAVIRSYVNRQLARGPAYTGSVGDIDVNLWRGAYVIRQLRVLKVDGHVPVPFFEAPRVDLSVAWKELLHGAIVGEIEVQQPTLNFVAGPTAGESQTGRGKDWRQTVESLFPLRLNRVKIDSGRVHFRNFQSEPPVDIYLRDFSCLATNLSNSRDLTNQLPAGVFARGHTIGDGVLSVALHLNPLATSPTYKLETSLTNLNLVAVNDFLRAYGHFDVDRGTAAIFVEVAAAGGHYEGYVKPLFENIDVFAWQKERKKNIFQIFWQAVVGTATTVFKNQPRDRLATVVPISGDFGEKHVGILAAVGGVLENAFVRALLPKLDNSVHFDEVVREHTPEDK